MSEFDAPAPVGPWIDVDRSEAGHLVARRAAWLLAYRYSHDADLRESVIDELRLAVPLHEEPPRWKDDLLIAWLGPRKLAIEVRIVDEQSAESGVMLRWPIDPSKAIAVHQAVTPQD